MSEYGRLLPSEFIPQLREQAAIVKIDGGMKDYELPEINEDLAGSVFDTLLGGGATDEGSQDPLLLKKYNDLIKEQTLLKEEHKSNIKDLNTKIEDLDIQVKCRSEKIAELQKQLSNKDADLSKHRLDIEKLMKNLKDMSLSFSLGQRMNEETIARKTKEVETLMREKKCKNCVLCLEDLKDRNAATDLNLI